MKVCFNENLDEDDACACEQRRRLDGIASGTGCSYEMLPLKCPILSESYANSAPLQLQFSNAVKQYISNGKLKCSPSPPGGRRCPLRSRRAVCVSTDGSSPLGTLETRSVPFFSLTRTRGLRSDVCVILEQEKREGVIP